MGRGRSRGVRVARFPGRFRYVREERQGLSYAGTGRSRRPATTSSPSLDDDVEVDVDWLRHLASAYETAAIMLPWRPGRDLIYPGPAPMARRAGEGYLTKVDYGPDRRPAGPDELYGVGTSASRRIGRARLAGSGPTWAVWGLADRERGDRSCSAHRLGGRGGSPTRPCRRASA